MADPFADLIPQGGSEQGSATPALATTFGYKDPEDNGVGAWGDVTNRPDVHGVSLPIPVLKQQFGDPNKAHGQLVRVTNPETGQSIVAPIVDKGPADWVVARQGNTIDLTHATNAAIGGTGKTPVTYSFVGKEKQSSDPFADLIPQQQATNAPAQASEQVSDPFADLIPQKQAQAQTNPDSAYLAAPTPTPEQTGKAINLPATPSKEQQAVDGELTEPAKRPVGFLEAAGRGIIGGLAKTNELMAKGVGIFPYVEDKTLQAFGIDSNIYNRYMNAVHATGLGKPTEEAEAIKPTEQLTTGGQIGLGFGEMGSQLPYMAMTGGIGAEEAAAQNAFQVVKPLMPRITESIQAMMPMAAQAGADAVEQSAQQGDNPIVQTAKGIAQATATAAIGVVPLSARSKIVNPLGRFLEQGAYGYITGLPIGEQQKVVDSWVNGKPYVPSEWKDMAIQAIPMAFMTGAFGVLHAPETQAKIDAASGGPEPTLSPSKNPIVNQREEAILASADAQAPVPEAPTPAPAPAVETPAAKAPAADLTSLILDQTLYDEGSPEWNAIQAQIEALKKPAEAPTEAPTAKPNITQEASDLLNKLDQSGSTLPSINNNVTRILRENGIEVTDQMTPEEAINALREKAKQTAEAPAVESSLANLGGMGGGITDSLYKTLWDKAQAGETQEGGQPSTILSLASKVREQGGLQSFDEFKNFVQEVSSIPEGNKEERQNALREIAQKYSQPTEEPKNAVQEQTTGEVGVRNAPAVGEGVGAENKPEVPAKEAEAPKEEVAPPEPAKPEEVKSNLSEQVQSDFIDFARKTGKLTKAQAQKALAEYEKAGNIKVGEDGQFYFTKGEHSSRESLRKAAGIEEAPQESPSSPIRDILRRFQSGEEDSIDTLKGLADSVNDAAKKTKNKYLADLASEIQDAVDAGVEIGDAQVLVNRTLAALESEANRMEAPKEKKTPAERVKTRKDKARDVFGDAAEGLSYVLENKILDPAEYRKRVKAGIIQGGGEYDFFYNHKFPKKVRDLIFSRTGRPIDIVSDDAGFKNPHDLLVAIDEAHRTAEASKEQAAEIEKRQKAREENIRKMAELEKTDPEAHAAEVENDVRKYLQGRMRSEGGYFTLPEIIYDAAVSVGRSVAKGARDFKSWSGEMINRLGEGVRNFLRRIYNAVSTGGGRFLERGAERGAIDLTGEERFKPKPPTEQEAFAKKAADAILKGRGTPITQDELANILARKFPGISPREVGDLYATASGKPKTPTPYAGVAATQGETPEKISIRTKDQEDQVRRGILTSPIPAGEGTSRQEILNQGNANLQNGADPYQALERAKQGDFNALTTAKAYAQALAKQVSEALRKFGPESKEYKDLAKQYQDYYEGIREAGTVASDILRTFQGETDLSDAADIAREYTKITGEEPSLGKHDQIRKVADKVDKTIKESGEATQKVRDTLDESLSDVEVKTPESIEESQQQIADLSDAAGKKSKEEIERLNNELEQTKRDLEEVRKAKETGQDAESLRRYYEAKLKDFNDQLESQPKYGKEVFETAKKIVDKWKADAAEAEKLLRKQLNQMGSSPDPTIILTLARIMRAHIGELALDFTKSSAMLVEKFGPKIKPFLKDAWAKAQELIKGENGGEKAVKSVRKGTEKAKSVEKMTPAEKAADSLRRRIAQAQKKIDDLNSGRITTPKEVEKVTNEEIQRLESEYSQKKKELSDARLKAKQKQLFEKGKVGEDLNPEQVKTLWESAKKFYLDKGESDYDKMISDLASDFGLTPAQVRKAFASPKGAKRASDEMYLKQRNRQMALDEAKRWLDNQKASWIGKVFGTAAEKTFKLAIFGHGTAFIGTHAPQTLYTHPRAAFKAWLKGLSYSFRGKSGRIQNIVDNKDLINRPNWIVARKGGLENDPREIRREGATPTRSDTVLAKALDTISGGRGFDALFHLRQDIFDQAWNQLSITQRTPEMAEMLANNINNATGFTKGGKRTAGILQSPITKVLFFAPKLIASRFKWLIQDPARMIGTFAKMATPFAKVTPEERMSAVYEAKNKAKFLGVLTGTLLANQALLSVTGSNQSINFTDPKKNDWLAYKGFGYNLATVGAFTRIARLLASEYNAVFGDLSRWQKAKGGREQAMKDALYTYLRSGLSPITRDIIVASTGKDYVGNTVPWSSEQPDRGRRKLTWREIIQEQFAPIPISEAATQKEILPAAVKAGSAAFLGTRLETPADIEEYEKSLKSKAKPSGGLGSSRGLGKGL